MFSTHVGSVTDGGGRKKRKLGSSYHVLTRRLSSHFAGARFAQHPSGRPEPGSKKRKRFCAGSLCSNDKLMISCDVESYRRHGGQFSS